MRKFFPVLFLLLSLQTAALGKEKNLYDSVARRTPRIDRYVR